MSAQSEQQAVMERVMAENPELMATFRRLVEALPLEMQEVFAVFVGEMTANYANAVLKNLAERYIDPVKE